MLQRKALKQFQAWHDAPSHTALLVTGLDFIKKNQRFSRNETLAGCQFHTHEHGCRIAGRVEDSRRIWILNEIKFRETLIMLIGEFSDEIGFANLPCACYEKCGM